MASGTSQISPAVSSDPTPSGTSLAAGEPVAGATVRAPAALPGSEQRVPLHFSGPALVCVCAWCESVYAIKLNVQVERTALSHGICAKCAKTQQRKQP